MKKEMIEMIKKLSNYLYFLDGYDSGIGRRGRELREEAQSLLDKWEENEDEGN